MKNILLIVAFFAFTFSVSAQVKLTPKDLKLLEGNWVGTLTYVDYSSGKSTSIKSNLNVTKKSDRKWNFAYVYPLEPKANSSDDVGLDADGVVFDNETVESKRKLKDGTLEFVTWTLGTDNDKRARFRHTYRLNKKSLSRKKEVQVEGTDNYFERNTYMWSR